jgi:hypothetical protein
MLHKHRLRLLLSLFVCLRAAAECLPAWDEPAVTATAPQVWLIGQTVADFNGDGRSDVIVASPTTLFFTPNTDGAFKFGTIVEIEAATDIRDLHAADVNGDGDMDVIVYDNTPKAIRVLLGNGDGTFGAPIQTSTGLNNVRMAPGHFDGDGKLDLAVYSFGSTTAGVFRGNGSGTFTSGGSFISITTLARRPAAGDLNGDGLLDLVLSVADASKLLVFTGNGNGTLDAPVEVNAALNVTHYVLGDVDDDGDVDIIESAHAAKAVAVILNQGGGTFAAPVLYSTVAPFASASGGVAFGIVLADVTGDGVPEITAALGSDRGIVSFQGNGDGTFGSPTFSRFGFFRPVELFPADVDGDEEQDDVVVGFDRFHGTIPNGCGAVQFQSMLENPVIAESQTTTVTVQLSATTTTVPAAPGPTGEVQLFNGATMLWSTILDESGSGTLTIAEAPIGEHHLHMRYAGDDRYHPLDLLPLALRVVSDSQIPAISIAADPATWGTSVRLHGTVTTAAGNVPNGAVEIFRGDVKAGEAQVVEGVWNSLADGDLAVGTYHYRARYKGGPSHPPSVLSAPLSVEVTKAASSIHRVLAQDVARAGAPVQIDFETDPDAGKVSLYDGTKLLQTLEGTSGRYVFTITLAEGRHTLKGRYQETATHLPSETTFDLVVLPQGQVAINASVVNGTVETVWAGSVLQQWVPNFGWMAVASSSPLRVTNPVPGNLYAYRAILKDVNHNTIDTATDAVVFTTFSDGTLAKGTTVKAAHVTELVAAINAWRNAVNLTPISIANAVPGKTIRAADVNTLNGGMNAARAATGMPVLGFQFIEKGAKIRAVDLQQLRDLLVR